MFVLSFHFPFHLSRRLSSCNVKRSTFHDLFFNSHTILNFVAHWHSEKLAYERVDPEIAWILFHQVYFHVNITFIPLNFDSNLRHFSFTLYLSLSLSRFLPFLALYRSIERASDSVSCWMIFGILQATRLFSSIQKFDKTCGDFPPPKSAIFLASWWHSSCLWSFQNAEEEDNAGLAGEDKKKRFLTNKKLIESQVFLSDFLSLARLELVLSTQTCTK